MTSDTPEQPPYPWLPPARVLRWLKLDNAGTELTELAEDCRLAAAAYVEEQRRDLVVPATETTPASFTATDAVVQAGVLIAGRLFARRNSPAGLVSFAELGPAEVVRFDPDAARLLRRGPQVV